MSILDCLTSCQLRWRMTLRWLSEGHCRGGRLSGKRKEIDRFLLISPGYFESSISESWDGSVKQSRPSELENADDQGWTLPQAFALFESANAWGVKSIRHGFIWIPPHHIPSSSTEPPYHWNHSMLVLDRWTFVDFDFYLQSNTRRRYRGWTESERGKCQRINNASMISTSNGWWDRPLVSICTMPMHRRGKQSRQVCGVKW